MAHKKAYSLIFFWETTSQHNVGHILKPSMERKQNFIEEKKTIVFS